jgi:hypothetical protein
MRILLFYTCVILLATGCSRQPVDKAVWINQADTLIIQDLQPRFATGCGEWKAVLYSSVQPLELHTSFSDNLLTLSAAVDAAVIEGPAQICLENGKQLFYYPVYLKNKAAAQEVYKEFRSPKTVNPDSGLVQQRIIYSRDVNCNLLAIRDKSVYFFEDEMKLAPRAAVERAVKDDALSAFYVQPGSCIAIPLQAVFRMEEKIFYVTAGPLKDKYGNTVADGTLVSFNYGKAAGTAHMEATLLNGFASVSIPLAGNDGCRLLASVNNIVSQPVYLKTR